MSVSYLSILVAEDNRVNQLYMKTLLEKEGHTVTIASDGEETVQLFRENRNFDLILMDVQMPEIDGLEAAIRIRRFERENHLDPTPIFALSAYDDMEDSDQYRNGEINLFLPKPLSGAILKKALSEIFPKKEPNNPVDSQQVSELPPSEYQIHLLREYADAEDTLISILEMALADIPVRMKNIEKTFQSGDSESAAREAHSLANIVGVLHRPRERSTALNIEKKLEAGEWSAARMYYAELKDQIHTLTRTFHSILFGTLSK